MANCRLCEHCHGQVIQGDHPIVRNGYSYHRDCLKCYVCSETDLRNSEIFKGVIFCRSCTKRIFASCATVREDKRLMGQRGDEAWGGRREEPKPPLQRSTKEERGYNNAPFALNKSAVKKFSYSTSTSSLGSFKTSLSFDKNKFNDSGSVVDIGVATEVTQTILDTAFNDSLQLIEYIKAMGSMYSPEKVHPKQNCLINDDLRMAEFGASTEVANLGLQGHKTPESHDTKSHPMIVIKSSRSNEKRHSKSAKEPQSKRRHHHRRNLPHVPTNDKLKQRSAAVKQSRLTLTKSKPKRELLLKSSQNAEEGLPLRLHHQRKRKHRHRRRKPLECVSSHLSLPHRDVRSVMKIPYKLFKMKIIRRSSIMSYLSERQHQNQIFEKKRNLYRNADSKSYQRQGIRVLYAAINHRKTPCKLGWLDLKPKTSCCIKSGDCTVHTPKCRHYRRSRTYRHMRRKVMKIAGPTKDQLTEFRWSVVRKIIPTQVANFLTYMSKYSNTTTRSAAVLTEPLV